MMIGFRKLGFRDDLLEYGRSLRNLAKCNLSENSPLLIALLLVCDIFFNGSNWGRFCFWVLFNVGVL